MSGSVRQSGLRENDSNLGVRDMNIDNEIILIFRFVVQ